MSVFFIAKMRMGKKDNINYTKGCRQKYPNFFAAALLTYLLRDVVRRGFLEHVAFQTVCYAPICFIYALMAEFKGCCDTEYDDKGSDDSNDYIHTPYIAGSSAFYLNKSSGGHNNADENFDLTAAVHH